MDENRYKEIRKIMKEKKVGFSRAEEILEEQKTKESLQKLFKK
jgi:hypothetical protein